MRLNAPPHPVRVTLAAFYVAAVLGVPLVHAYTEVPESNVAIEAGHSGACSILHVASVCSVGSAIKTPAVLNRLRAPAEFTARVSPTTDLPRISSSRLGPARDRSPPTGRR